MHYFKIKKITKDNFSDRLAEIKAELEKVKGYYCNATFEGFSELSDEQIEQIAKVFWSFYRKGKVCRFDLNCSETDIISVGVFIKFIQKSPDTNIKFCKCTSESTALVILDQLKNNIKFPEEKTARSEK